MLRFLLPLGLAVFYFSPSSAQTVDVGAVSVVKGEADQPPYITQPTVALTLEMALKQAFEANPALLAAAHESAAERATITQAQLFPNPHISTQIEDTRRATRVTTLQLNQLIELGGKRDARVEAAERGGDVALATLAAKRADVRAEVELAFVDLLTAQQRLQLAEHSMALAGRVTVAAARRVMAGKVSPVEESKARVAEAEVRLLLLQARSDLTMARQRLAATWGDAGALFESVVGDLSLLPALPSLTALTRALVNSPVMLRERSALGRRQALLEVERRRRIPDVTVSLGVKRAEELARDQAVLGLSIPIPLFDRNQGNVLETLRRTDKARDELVATELHLTVALAQAHAGLSVARQTVDALRSEILPGAHTAYDVVTRGFELGKFNFLEVLDAQRTLIQAELQHLRALSDAHRAAVEIERLLGGLPAVSSLANR